MHTLLRRLLPLSAVLLITGAYIILLLAYFVPGIPGGVDQNAYHVAGAKIADDGTFYRKTSDEFEYVGSMWVCNERQEYYPKYPPGYPALIAAANRACGNGAGLCKI